MARGKNKGKPKDPEGKCANEKGNQQRVQGIKAKIIQIFQKHNPSKLEDLESLWAKYEGKEKELLDAVKQKYFKPDIHKSGADRKQRAKAGRKSARPAKRKSNEMNSDIAAGDDSDSGTEEGDTETEEREGEKETLANAASDEEETSDEENDEDNNNDEEDDTEDEKTDALERDSDIVELYDDKRLDQHCRQTKLTKTFRITNCGRRQYVVRCRQKLEHIMEKQKSHKTEGIAPKNKTRGLLGKCKLHDDPTKMEETQDLGEKSSLTLKSILTAVAKKAKGKRGTKLFVPLCGNKGCLMANHYGPATAHFDLTSDTDSPVAPAPAKKVKKSNLTKPSASAAAVAAPAASAVATPAASAVAAGAASAVAARAAATRRKDPPKPECFGSIQCPHCGTEITNSALAFRLCDHEKTCGPWHKTCEACLRK